MKKNESSCTQEHSPNVVHLIQAAPRITLDFSIRKQLLHLFSLYNTTYHIFMRLRIQIIIHLKLEKLAPFLQPISNFIQV